MYKLYAAIFIVSIFLSACGGGGSNTDYPMPADPMPADPMPDDPMPDDPMPDDPMPADPMPDDPMPENTFICESSNPLVCEWEKNRNALNYRDSFIFPDRFKAIPDADYYKIAVKYEGPIIGAISPEYPDLILPRIVLKTTFEGGNDDPPTINAMTYFNDNNEQGYNPYKALLQPDGSFNSFDSNEDSTGFNGQFYDITPTDDLLDDPFDLVRGTINTPRVYGYYSASDVPQ